ncbi:hypothetical protein PsYK624_121400 [Phanerochaete sordida]|uniref:Uncharacterized protein n=1 Tax=Phanerochaete sordida TaxID=48140 RepID=A0A9P3GJ91_9APHY|nr:hypothetical protein PsYK624_121400 [Phanerochaete sordida]
MMIQFVMLARSRRPHAARAFPTPGDEEQWHVPRTVLSNPKEESTAMSFTARKICNIATRCQPVWPVWPQASLEMLCRSGKLALTVADAIQGALKRLQRWHTPT